MRSLALLILFTACHEQRELPPPSTDPSTIGMLLLALEGDRLEWATAFDLSAGEGYPPIAWRGDVELVSLEYGCSIERLGLARGRQPLSPLLSNEVRLPPPRRMMSTMTDSPEWVPAETSDRIDAALRSIALADDNACRAQRAKYDPKPLAIPIDGHLDPVFLLPYDRETTLVGSVDGKVYRVSKDGQVEREQALEDRTYLGAYLSPSGELWMMSDEGVLARGTIDGLEAVSSTSAFGERATRIALSGPKDARAPFEIFATARIDEDQARAFVRFDGDRWYPIARGPRHDSLFYPATVWIEPHHALAIGVGSERNAIARYRDGTISEELLPSSSGPSSMLQHPTLGTIVGMDDGTIAHHITEWEAFVDGPDSRFVRTLAPSGDGFIFGSSFELNFLSYRFSQYHPAVGFCDGEVLTESIATLLLGRIGDDDLLAATLQGFDSPLGLTLLQLREPSGACSGD